MKRTKAILAAALAGSMAISAAFPAMAQEDGGATLVDLFYTYSKDNMIVEYYDSNYLTESGKLQKKSYDGFLALSQTDLDWDGTEELLAIRLKPAADENGDTINTLIAEVYQRKDNTLQRSAQYTLAEDILAYDGAQIDVFAVDGESGQFLCCEARDSATLLADGVTWSMRAAGYDGESFYEVSNVSMAGSAFSAEDTEAARTAMNAVGLYPQDLIWASAAEQCGLGLICTVRRYHTSEYENIRAALDAGQAQQYGETWFKNYMNPDRENKFAKEFAVKLTESAGQAQTAQTDGVHYSFDGDYVIPDSDSRYITEEDLSSLSADEILLARNEIYAKHGRIFNNAALDEYFRSKSWYQPTVAGSDFTDSYAASVFNDCEIANISTMVKYEKAHGLNGY
ncbi:YARHG domain-containing protein [Marvinbryantia sp.]|uniref:YARHG domain-containing protein n=1 Tax=Marvinbryantia sp. TaxID=2496532 RepID=UPI0025D5047A|nr:YARHG domain-containing protein [uncultured Marvinbryantia sp.]